MTDTDDGTATDGSGSNHTEGTYLDERITLFSASTPFMRDNLKVIWGTFILWVLFVFGPVTATALAPEMMTQTIPGDFQLHFFLTAIGAPLGALILSAVYAYQRDRLDNKYGIEHGEDVDSNDDESGGPEQ